MSPYIIDYIEKHIEEIESEDWRTVLEMCDIEHTAELCELLYTICDVDTSIYQNGRIKMVANELAKNTTKDVKLLALLPCIKLVNNDSLECTLRYCIVVDGVCYQDTEVFDPHYSNLMFHNGVGTVVEYLTKKYL